MSILLARNTRSSPWCLQVCLCSPPPPGASHLPRSLPTALPHSVSHLGVVPGPGHQQPGTEPPGVETVSWTSWLFMAEPPREACSEAALLGGL